MKPVSLVLTILFILFSVNSLPGKNIKTEEIKPKVLKIIQEGGENNPLKLPRALCTTEDRLMMVSDYGAGDVKIYEKDDKDGEIGFKRIATLGRKGYGENGFLEPAYSSYNAAEGKYILMDYGRKKIFLYDRLVGNGRVEFKRTGAIPCLRLGYAVQLVGNRLLVSGGTSDEKNDPFALYSLTIDYRDKGGQKQELIVVQKDFLLSAFKKYGNINSREEYNKKNTSVEIGAIGRKGWFAVEGSNIFYIWEGDLSIHKVNMNTKGYSSFAGRKTGVNYKKPIVSIEMREGYAGRNSKVLQRELKKVSLVRALFASSKHLLVVYEGPGPNFTVQYYNIDNGKFIKEVRLGGQPSFVLHYSEEEKTLYSLSTGSSTNAKEYFVLEYKIYE